MKGNRCTCIRHHLTLEELWLTIQDLQFKISAAEERKLTYLMVDLENNLAYFQNQLALHLRESACVDIRRTCWQSAKPFLAYH